VDGFRRAGPDARDGVIGATCAHSKRVFGPLPALQKYLVGVSVSGTANRSLLGPVNPVPANGLRAAVGDYAMTSMTLLLSLAAVDLLSIATPGPNVLLVTQTAVKHGRVRAMCAVAGILAGSLIWAGFTLMGLTAFLAVVPFLETMLRIAGAAFLICMGVQLMRKPTAQPATGDVAASTSAVRAMLHGFATGALNPKSLAYFGTIFVLFVPADASAAYRVSAFAIVIFDGILVYGAMAMLFSTGAARSGYLAVRRPIDRVCGALIAAFGIRLMLRR
jgi:threonine efflux protein